ncbi:SAM-dependent methyltransferase [Nocardia sp. ET3-3]|uniref:S-adenosyl-L-methionine-dependent methyltransferase n=1 Tax=Nocardia terrae TaxID=2675851 RepID=A0A7K1V5S1_9NOCA|nr:SAM-dependent methyltransferase [Nocardia terrae]MVU81995.1 SAM-dependent methyltransferase [Nocardia terrae]
MQNGEPSRTALGAARHRADHQKLDGASIFRDPLAVAVLTPLAESADRSPTAAREDDAARRRLRLFIAARSRYTEDALADAYRAGIRQAIILGAGLDTFAYRNPHSSLRVFEVDHPATQSWKRQLLADTGIGVPASVTYLGADFERDTLEDVLAAGDFDASQPAFVIWLGVTIYLTRPAIAATLNTLGRLAPGSELVLDYGEPLGPQTAEERAVAEERDRRLAAIGESWISRFTPEEIAAELKEAGLAVVEDLGPVATFARYLGTPTAPERPGPHILRAEVV